VGDGKWSERERSDVCGERAGDENDGGGGGGGAGAGAAGPTPLGLWPGGSAAVHLGASLLCVLIFGLPSAAARVGRFLTIPFAPGYSAVVLDD
jgi:hypothetical protein